MALTELEIETFCFSHYLQIEFFFKQQSTCQLPRARNKSQIEKYFSFSYFSISSAFVQKFFWFQPQTCLPMLGINLLFGKSFFSFEQVFVHNSQFFHLIESFERVSKVLETGQTENVLHPTWGNCKKMLRQLWFSAIFIVMYGFANNQRRAFSEIECLLKTFRRKVNLREDKIWHWIFWFLLRLNYWIILQVVNIACLYSSCYEVYYALKLSFLYISF